MKKALLLIPFLLTPFTQSQAALSEKTLTEGWRFAKGEQPLNVVNTDFDDSGWQNVRVPHDWAIAGPFDPDGDGGTGRLPWRGFGTYRLHLPLDNASAGTRAYLNFDGVMAKAKVYVNGQLAGTWDYGYTSFQIDVTPYVQFGSDNLITVEADTRQGQWDSRWYPGAGIYRKVVLELDNPVHIAHWGSVITTDGDELAARTPKTLRVPTRVENHLNRAQKVSVNVVLTAPDGSPAGEKTQDITVPANYSYEAVCPVHLDNPVLWDVDNPALYTVSTTVMDANGTVLDRSAIRYGIRTFAFTADDGFHLNGRRVQLYGVDLHSDLGPLGMAFNKSAMRRELEILQDTGVNAIRTSHNPPAPEMLDLCDEMGMVVWDEAFDKWNTTAGRFDGKPDLREFGHRQIESLVMRDRNHPSVVIWSIGNELYDESPLDGISPQRVDFMSSYVREFDRTRPVALGCNVPSMAYGANFDSLDLTGWNYDLRYRDMRREYPEKPLLYSESASAVSSRGYYEPDLPDMRNVRNWQTHQVSSYDFSASDWSDIPEVEFERMRNDSYMAGEFVWTGFDYLGEPTPFDFEARSSYFGFVDLCGIPKDRFYLYRSYWRPNVTTVHILPHWNWTGREGQTVPVFVYTNGQSAELFLNGKSLGKREKGPAPIKRPADLVPGASLTASSNQPGHEASLAADGDGNTSWLANADDSSATLTLDLGKTTPIGKVEMVLDKEEKFYDYTIEASSDGNTWTKVLDKPTSLMPPWGGLKEITHFCDASGRYLRITFGKSRDGAVPGIRSLKIFSEPVPSEYYDVTYQYRLRWDDVKYQPGELRAVAYDKAGNRIGEATVRTAGPAAKLRLTPEETVVSVKADELAYILVEATDRDGNLAPLADNKVHFSVEGGEIAGMGNGNPMCFESMQGDQHSLFYGKAMLIVRPTGPGEIHVTATAEDLENTTTVLEAR